LQKLEKRLQKNLEKNHKNQSILNLYLPYSIAYIIYMTKWRINNFGTYIDDY